MIGTIGLLLPPKGDQPGKTRPLPPIPFCNTIAGQTANLKGLLSSGRLVYRCRFIITISGDEVGPKVQ